MGIRTLRGAITSEAGRFGASVLLDIRPIRVISVRTRSREQIGTVKNARVAGAVSRASESSSQFVSRSVSQQRSNQ